MNIIIEGKRAVLKKDFSLEYNEENPLFSDSEGYTLSIEFPLKNCAENLRIFGHIQRTDIDTKKGVFPCSIISASFWKEGIFTVTEISQTEIKGQFLCGLSSKNYTQTISPLEKKYVDEMNIGELSYKRSPEVVFYDYTTNGAKSILLPWKNNEEEKIYNNLSSVISGDSIGYTWIDPDEPPTPFPYLLPLTRSILEKVGYSVDLREWERSRSFANIIACNAFDGQTYLSQSLPHWTIREYLDKLASFMFGNFYIDDIKKRISFSFYKGITDNSYAIKKILNSYRLEITDDCKYFGSCALKYGDIDHENWKFDSCDELMSNYSQLGEWASVHKEKTFAELIQYVNDRGYTSFANQETPDNYIGSLFYVEDIDTFFCMRFFDYVSLLGEYYYILTPVNRFGKYNSDKENETEIEIVPAIISRDYNYVIVFPRKEEGGFITSKFKDSQPTFAANVLNECKQPLLKSFDTLYVANARKEAVSVYLRPTIDVVPYYLSSYIDDDVNYRLSRIKNELPTIDESTKYEIEFISDDMPSVFSIFYIQGKKYLCEKITVDITPNGVSQLKKGIFYKIID